MRSAAVLLLKGAVIFGGLIAAGFWLASALVTVPDNQDTFIAALQKIALLNSMGATGASAAAISALVLWFLGE